MATNVQEHLNAMCDTYASITQEVGLQVGCEHLLVLPTPTLNFSRQQVDIVFSIDGVGNLMNIVVTNPTKTYLFHQSLFYLRFQGFRSNTC
jgi:hypothetical protein